MYSTSHRTVYFISDFHTKVVFDSFYRVQKDKHKYKAVLLFDSSLIDLIA
jgi:hypothetical protein